MSLPSWPCHSERSEESVGYLFGRGKHGG